MLKYFLFIALNVYGFSTAYAGFPPGDADSFKPVLCPVQLPSSCEYDVVNNALTLDGQHVSLNTLKEIIRRPWCNLEHLTLKNATIDDLTMKAMVESPLVHVKSICLSTVILSHDAMILFLKEDWKNLRYFTWQGSTLPSADVLAFKTKVDDRIANVFQKKVNTPAYNFHEYTLILRSLHNSS